MDEAKRASYWNEEYFDYWKKRVEEANRNKAGEGSDVIKRDFKIPSDQIYENFLKDGIRGPGKLLDIGCGWGRLFGIYASMGMQIYGVDISKKMVEEARKCGIPQVVEVNEGTAESLRYEDDFFDYLTCFGVFDATYQEIALSEFIRVLKKGGRLFLTGKNDSYCQDDEEAMLAEAGARRKGEPNYFTKVKGMIAQLNGSGHRVAKGMYFERRGDFGKGRYLETIPERFYEYLILIEKGHGNDKFEKFANESSTVGKAKGEI